MTHKELLAVCRHYLGSHYYYRKVVDQIKEYTDGIGLTFDDIARILVYWYDVKKQTPLELAAELVLCRTSTKKL